VLNALRAAEVRFEMGENSVSVWKSDIRAFEFDATDCPDLFPPLVALAAFADGVTVLHGASRLIHKESNRAKTLQQEFAKAGIRIVLRGDEMKIYPAAIRSAHLHSHSDHRIAMAGALLGMGGAHMTIQNASVVAKSFPGFYSLMKALGARITGA
jgi:3-phosphoshikimate 1-carboxyvinyltransferase